MFPEFDAEKHTVDLETLQNETNEMVGIIFKNGSMIRMIDTGETIRTFDTGATRDTAANKFQYTGYLSPYFINEFGRYMNRHQLMPDGTRRAPDNWQKGIPMDVYQDSMWRHFFDTWAVMRGNDVIDENGKSVDLIESIMGLVFNLQGIVHETLKNNPIQRGA